ncbi:MAG: hypothetical protein HYW07_08705 [Candidatus Latescibacteria bacterium]|nr:hypothetical protein [Candidatus Latescibacterota bacterium]
MFSPLTAYGWAGAVALGHGFHELETLPENDRVRYTISPEARKEVLRRLLALNHERAAAQVEVQAEGSVKKKWGKKGGAKVGEGQGDLFT